MGTINIQRIATIVQAQIRANGITPEKYDVDLQTLGVDSLNLIQIIIALEEEFGCEIPDSKLFSSELNTINKIYSVLVNDARKIATFED